MVQKGHSRQEVHEQIRVLSHQATLQVKQHGKPNDLLDRIKSSEFFKDIWNELDELTDKNSFMGRSVQQAEKFCKSVDEVLSKHGGLLKNVVLNEITV
jgi:adenylosuccinate lyase